MQELFELLLEKGLTISSCESLTGGLFASELTRVPHVSNVFKGSIVTYWNSVKEFAGVDSETLEKYGAVSQQTAYQMAKGVQEKLQTNIGVSFTGNAGPSVMEGKPCGLVYTCIVIDDKEYPFEDLIIMERNELREEIVNRTVSRLLKLLKENLPFANINILEE